MTPPPLQNFLFLVLAGAVAPAAPQTPESNENNVQVTFQPSIAVVIGIFSVMFTLTFLLLMYAKFCRINASSVVSATVTGRNAFPVSGIGSGPEAGRISGVDKAVIESLPFFRFSTLRGTRQGLECAVCLSRFNDAEILRLLPRCKHAFHMACVDRWLESHSSCPLCRTRVDADDIAFFKLSTSSRCLFRDPSSTRLPAAASVDDAADPELELYIERENAGGGGSSSEIQPKLKKTSQFLCGDYGKPTALHNLKHRIIVSDVVLRSRWSDFNSADLMCLDSEMLRVASSRRLSSRFDELPPAGAAAEVSKIREEMEMKRRLESKAIRMHAPAPEDCSADIYADGDVRALISPASRCMSDITAVARYRPPGSHGGKEDRMRQLWLPIARRTVRWFAGKERRSLPQSQISGDAAENIIISYIIFSNNLAMLSVIYHAIHVINEFNVDLIINLFLHSLLNFYKSYD
ncbi:E3 ubiquitin-protein ligase ATL42 [Apostasia shenzhenica]|uniref:RING-type E3 ubiquitin transferase n=1 Tax=Apostasia shenzhenica TaxID=1088818 RepID=A0A2I0B087_9ASPA|nr:E3 ubiquitin-protein ligase ATL42 [Apostasia shenzhenica]